MNRSRTVLGSEVGERCWPLRAAPTPHPVAESSASSPLRGRRGLVAPLVGHTGCCRAAGRRQHGTGAGLASARVRGMSRPSSECSSSPDQQRAPVACRCARSGRRRGFPSVTVAASSRPAPGSFEGQPPCRRKRGVQNRAIKTRGARQRRQEAASDNARAHLTWHLYARPATAASARLALLLHLGAFKATRLPTIFWPFPAKERHRHSLARLGSCQHGEREECLQAGRSPGLL